MASKEPRIGRPPMYKTVAEMQKKIDAYFAECDGKVLHDSDGGIVYDKQGNPVVVRMPYSITGLALALGFNSRQALINYQVKEEFHDAITRAKAKIEQYNISRLYDKDGVRGAIFVLVNGFEWSDKSEVKSDIDATVKVELTGELADYSK